MNNIELYNRTKYKHIGNYILNFAKQVYKDNENLQIILYRRNVGTGIFKGNDNLYTIEIDLQQLIDIKRGHQKIKGHDRILIMQTYCKNLRLFFKFVLLHELGHKFYKHCLISPSLFNEKEIQLKDLYCDIFAEVNLLK